MNKRNCMIKLFSLLTVLITCSYAHARILIFTYAYNRTDFIEIQHKTFKKFMLDDYEFIVFNDAKTDEMAQRINDTCTQLGIRCVRIPQEIHDQPYLKRSGESYHAPSVRNCNVVQYSLNTMGFDHDDIVVLIDSDLFLVKPLSIREFMNGYSLGGLRQNRAHIEYLWIGLVFIDMRTLPNKHTLTFNCGATDGLWTDAGGHSYFYLKNNPEAKVCYINGYHESNFRCNTCNLTKKPVCSHNTSQLKEMGFDTNQIRLFQTANWVEFFHEQSFLHYGSGTNWNNKDVNYHQIKTDALNTYIASIL